MGKAQSDILSGRTYRWTRHAQEKARYYKLSESRIRRIIKSPLRREEGIAEGTQAAMQPSSYKRKDGKQTWNQELWVMYQTKKDNTIVIISAWRYPGKTTPSQPLPDMMVHEIEEALSTI